MFLIATAITFIACHGGPADHFATFAEKLKEEGHQVRVYASGPALKKFEERHVDVALTFNAEGLSKEEGSLLAAQIARSCNKTELVITDVGHSFDLTLQKALAEEAPSATRAAYYDNPEPYVPGGYSKVAAEVVLAAQRVLFANANLASQPIYSERDQEVKLPPEKRIGVGYYPTEQAEKVAAKRAESGRKMRVEFFAQNALKERGQKLLVYFGGNNEEYFSRALPALLRLIDEGMEQKDLSNIVLVLQQHPGAKSKNLDRRAFEAWIERSGAKTRAPKVIISDRSSDEMQLVADAALYYQTSMGPLFALAGIPTIQVGHERYEDILVRGGVSPSITNAAELIKAIAQVDPQPLSNERRRGLFASLGIRDNWNETIALGEVR
ncbi:MAG: hypothetical protein HYX48_08345 [Chlamydiales bacterium]|nr:hypothetical protein [Chlamydiales bacterium]